MAKRRKKQRRVSSISTEGLLERDLKNTGIWISIAVVAVVLIAVIQKNVL